MGTASTDPGLPAAKLMLRCVSHCLSNGFVFLCSSYYVCVCVPVLLTEVKKEKFIVE